MPILLLLLGGVAIFAIARASAASSNTPLLTRGDGAGGGGAPAAQVAELSSAEKTALAGSLGTRWVNNEKMNVANDADTMDLGAPGVAGEASAALVIAGANVQKNLFVLVNARSNPTKIIVPTSDSAAGRYATSGQWAIFLRPGEAATLFKAVGLDLGDVLKPHVIGKGDGGAETHMLTSGSGTSSALAPHPSPSAPLLPAHLSLAAMDQAQRAALDIQSLPDDKLPIVTQLDDGATITTYPLKNARERYALYLAGQRGSGQLYVSKSNLESDSRYLFANGYTNAAQQAFVASTNVP